MHFEWERARAGIFRCGASGRRRRQRRIVIAVVVVVVVVVVVMICRVFVQLYGVCTAATATVLRGRVVEVQEAIVRQVAVQIL